MVQAPPQMTVLASQAMPYPLTFQPQPGAPPGQLMPSADYADLGEGSLCSTHGDLSKISINCDSDKVHCLMHTAWTGCMCFRASSIGTLAGCRDLLAVVQPLYLHTKQDPGDQVLAPWTQVWLTHLDMCRGRRPAVRCTTKIWHLSNCTMVSDIRLTHQNACRRRGPAVGRQRAG